MSGVRGGSATFDALLDAAVDGIVVIDEQGTILSFNAAAEKLFGYSAEQVVGGPVQRLMPEPYRSEHPSYMRHYLETGEKKVIGIGREIEAQHSDGGVFPIWLSIGEAGTGAQRHFVGFIRDLSEQRAAEQERHVLESRIAQMGRFSLMGEMAAGIAHEINQPLSAIVTYSQAAKRLLDLPDLEKDAIEKACRGISDQVHRASKVIENLRGFIRKQEIQKEPLELNAVIRDAMTLVLADANAGGVRVVRDLAEGLPRIEGNAVQLQQVLLNLTRNAVDAIEKLPRKAKEIRIRTMSPNKNEVQFEVRDHGPGVSPRLGDGIFHPFVSTKAEGLGVGLAISKTIIEGHGGRLSYANSPEGGAVFTVSLPVRVEESR